MSDNGKRLGGIQVCDEDLAALVDDPPMFSRFLWTTYGEVSESFLMAIAELAPAHLRREFEIELTSLIHDLLEEHVEQEEITNRVISEVREMASPIE